jgi:hypothetical protein
MKRGLSCIYQNSQLPQWQTGGTEELQKQAVVPSRDISGPSRPFVDPLSLLPWSSADLFGTSPNNLYAADTSIDQSSSMFGNLGLFLGDQQDLRPIGNGFPAQVYNGSIQPQFFPFPPQSNSEAFSRIQLSNTLGSTLTLRAPRAFDPKRVCHRQLSLNRKYVVVRLSAYPRMMLPGNGMPPFIHPRCSVGDISSQGEVAQTFLPRPLATCSGIIAMWSVKNKDNCALIWKAIRTEQERISEEAGLSCTPWDMSKRLITA